MLSSSLSKHQFFSNYIKLKYCDTFDTFALNYTIYTTKHLAQEAQYIFTCKT